MDGASDRLCSICYCLAHDGADDYRRMLEISVNLVKSLEPQRTVVLVTDEQTRRQSSASGLEVPYVDEVVELAAPHSPVALRSRFLKTRMRSVLRGDFIYLDLDALPIRPLAGLRALNGDALAAACERCPPRGHAQVAPAAWQELFGMAGLKAPVGERVYNSGVLFMPDTAECHQLAERWHWCWSKLVATGLTHRDQHALTWAIRETGVGVTELRPTWNALVHVRPFDAIGARVLHYVYDGGNCDGNTLLDHLMSVLQDEGSIDWQAVSRARAGRAWTSAAGSLKRAVVMRDWSSVVRMFTARLKDRL